MLSLWFLLEHLSFFMLRVAPAAGSFPRPLSPAEEQEALRAMKTDELDFRTVDAGAEDQTANAAKTIDTNFDAHDNCLLI